MINTDTGPYQEMVAIDVSSADQTFDKEKTLRGLLISAAGNLEITDISGNKDILLLDVQANGGSFPFILPLQIKTIHTANTTIASSSLVGLR